MNPEQIRKFIDALENAARKPTSRTPGNDLRSHLAKVVFAHIALRPKRARKAKV